MENSKRGGLSYIQSSTAPLAETLLLDPIVLTWLSSCIDVLHLQHAILDCFDIHTKRGTSRNFQQGEHMALATTLHSLHLPLRHWSSIEGR